MNEITTAAAYVYMGQAVAFSLCLAMLGGWEWYKLTWLGSNMFGFVGMYLTIAGWSPLPGQTGLLGAQLIIISATLKAIALGEGRLFWRRNILSTALMVSGFLAITAAWAVSPDYRLLCMLLGGLCNSMACALRLSSARRWRGSWATTLIILSTGTSAIANFARLFTAYPLGPERTFMGTSSAQFASIMALITLSFFLQVGFLGLLASRISRTQLFVQRRAARVSGRESALKAAKAETDELLGERMALLKLLTHEVRQPLNNAQAALQSIMLQVSSPAIRTAAINSAARKTQAVLDMVVLSLSNAIVGTTLIERGKGVDLKPVDVVSISRLAMLDCTDIDQRRIAFHAPEDMVYACGDPVLLRLALRNLLDNALKYSPRQSQIDFDISIDEFAFCLRVKVSNDLADPFSLHGNIFERGKRGVDKTHEGFGVGLFIVSETARIHYGELCYYQSRPERVTFEVAIPL